MYLAQGKREFMMLLIGDGRVRQELDVVLCFKGDDIRAEIMAREGEILNNGNESIMCA
jgi:hypothetical protein